MGGVDDPRAFHGTGDREKAAEMKARVEEAAAALHGVSELSSGFEGAAGRGAGGGAKRRRRGLYVCRGAAQTLRHWGPLRAPS